MTDIKLVKATVADAEEIWQLQKNAFAQLLEKYHDFETSPASEPLDKTVQRLSQPFTYFYFITLNGVKIGAIRIVDKNTGEPKRISPLFITSQYRGKGYAQRAISEAEKIHGADNWELDTILQEKANCHLYEKMGYCKTDKVKQINDKLTLIFYKK